MAAEIEADRAATESVLRRSRIEAEIATESVLRRSRIEAEIEASRIRRLYYPYIWYDPLFTPYIEIELKNFQLFEATGKY